MENLIEQMSQASLNIVWDLKYYSNRRWIQILTVTPTMPFAEIMAAIHALQHKNLNLRLFEKNTPRSFNYNMYMTDVGSFKRVSKRKRDLNA